MNKGVKDVRKSIMERKKLRGLNPKTKSNSMKQIVSPLPQEEEKHGYFPSFVEDTNVTKQKSQLVTGFVIKGMLSIALFFAVAVLWQTGSGSLTSLKGWTSNALMNEFPFARVHHWYQETFGNPLAFTPQKNHATNDEIPLALPVNGSVTQTFQTNGKGIMIAPKETSEVLALRDGVIIFAGNDREMDKTVIIQHVDGSKTTYGYLSSLDVHLYQYVAANDQIGTFSPKNDSETVYFSIEKDNEYVDPVQVIKVDESS